MSVRHAGAVLWLVAATVIPAPASGEGLRELAVAWAQGDYRAPIVCVLDGQAREALRRVRIHPGRPGELPSTFRLTFHDLDAPAGISCSGVTGASEPNLVGELELAFDGRSRPDTGEVDFRNALRREGGFRFRVKSGHLRLGAPGAPLAELEDVDFAGGTAEVRSVPPGSDAARHLALFGAERQRALKLSAVGGPSLAFDLVELPAH